jgi:hypothetical protein
MLSALLSMLMVAAGTAGARHEGGFDTAAYQDEKKAAGKLTL